MKKSFTRDVSQRWAESQDALGAAASTSMLATMRDPALHRCLVTGGNRETKRRAFTDVAFDVDRAAEQFGQPLGDRKAQADAAETPRRGALGLPKRLEDKRQRVLRDPDAGILDLD